MVDLRAGLWVCLIRSKALKRLLQMQIYLVGGAVRDQLLGLKVKDRDWVVVGATPEQMVREGFRPVGKDFPVFLHPKTHEEYALARTERKSGKGYKGFTFHTSPDVTLEQDLIRRDLSINAMAMDSKGVIIDPYGGRHDLEQRQLRHVSQAFSEDPLRVLRVARFAARFADLGFVVAGETLALMQSLSAADELNHLSAERVWQEFERALQTPNPGVFLDVLSRCNALEKLMPELAPPVPSDMNLLNSKLMQSAEERFALLITHLIRERKPSDIDAGAEGCIKKCQMQSLTERLRVPNRYSEAMTDLYNWGSQISQFRALKPTAKLQLIEGLKLNRSFARLECIKRACELSHTNSVNLDLIKSSVSAVKSIDPKTLLAQGFTGPALGTELRARQIIALEHHH
jgi:tRNA nucleotidyltransferase (CCA-adding enzyme)